jgi:hypothetical protein
MIMQVSLGLFQQRMHECVSTNTTVAVENVFLIQDLDGLIIHVERTSLIQTKSKGIIHLKMMSEHRLLGQRAQAGSKELKGIRSISAGFEAATNFL